MECGNADYVRVHLFQSSANQVLMKFPGPQLYRPPRGNLRGVGQAVCRVLPERPIPTQMITSRGRRPFCSHVGRLCALGSVDLPISF